MTEEKMRNLLFSLAWYDASSYHSRNTKEILAGEFPAADFSAALDEFASCKTMPPGEGNPRSVSELVMEVNRLKTMVDRAHEALCELLSEHLNVASPAAEIAKRGLWGDAA